MGRHIVDSLTLLPFIAMLPPGAAVVDVGTGGGLPGIPLAIMRSDLRVTLLEATGKKARFCEQCAADLPLDNVRVIHTRAETAGRDPAHRQRYHASVCRAIGPMNVLLEYCLPLVRVGSHVLVMKGPKAEAELNAAAILLKLETQFGLTPGSRPKLAAMSNRDEKPPHGNSKRHVYFK